jgi:putative FmdB family regulatory protein
VPTYEYACRKCGHQFEKFQSMSEEPVKRCPKCKGRVDKLFSAGAGIIFKGSGFYQTDYRSESYKKAAASESKAAKPEKKESPAKKESKPAAAGKSTPAKG